MNLTALNQPVGSQIESMLEDVVVILERQLASNLTSVNTLCRHIERYRGKMLRPALVLVSGMAAQPGMEPTDDHLKLAAVMEMIHMATLVHDDVLDEADLRRRGATVNYLWGNEAAVILGDLLLSNAFLLCASIGNTELLSAVGEVTNATCQGELHQLHCRGDLGLSEETYFEIIGRKTGALIGACCRLGAELSGADEETCHSLLEIGTNLGIAFQIQDDLLDLIGEESVLGKPPGQDLSACKMTLPLIRLISSLDGDQRADALRAIKDGDRATTRRHVNEHGTHASSVQTATDHVDAARERIRRLPGSEAALLLEELSSLVLNRIA